VGFCASQWSLTFVIAAPTLPPPPPPMGHGDWLTAARDGWAPAVTELVTTAPVTEASNAARTAICRILMPSVLRAP
jgi:hypothetical protein